MKEGQNRDKNLVGFVVGGVRYAIDILRVREILNPLPVVVLPHAPSSILGVADHRGEVVPVLDLRGRFGLPPAGKSTRVKWVIVDLESRSIALVVDEVTDVFGAGADDHRDVPSLGSGEKARGIAAVYKYEGGLVFVVDLDQVAAPASDIDLGGLSDLAGVSSEGS
jgi:purine-binding chemotaxis protein CheW